MELRCDRGKPERVLKTLVPEHNEILQTGELFAGKKAVIFGVPGLPHSDILCALLTARDPADRGVPRFITQVPSHPGAPRPTSPAMWGTTTSSLQLGRSSLPA